MREEEGEGKIKEWDKKNKMEHMEDNMGEL